MASSVLSSRQFTQGRCAPCARFVLGRRASLIVSASVVAHTLWTSAAPAMAYRLYAQEWHSAT